MEKKEIDECVTTARAIINLTKQEQVILVFDMLGDEQISALEIAFYYRLYEKKFPNITRSEARQYVDQIINNYFEDERTEQLPLYEYILSNIKERKENG